MIPIDFPEITHRSPDVCPIGSRWHQHWREYTIALTRTAEAREACTRLRQGVNGPLLRPLTLEWHPGPGDASLFVGSQTPPLTIAKHEHVDGEFRGSGWVFGSLGGSGNSFPAFARIDDGLAVVVGFREGQYNRAPYVDLRGTPRERQQTGASS